MSDDKRALPAPIAELLRSLTPLEPGLAEIDRVPADFALPSAPSATIRASVDFVGTVGTVGASTLPAELRGLTRSRRRDLLALAWVLSSLDPQGRAAIIAPAGFATESTQAHARLRRMLVDQGRLHGVIALGGGCYRPRAAAVILLLGPEESSDIWFCEVAAASALSPPLPSEPECVERWRQRLGSERERSRGDSSFLVPRAEVAQAQYDLSIARYRIPPTDALPTRADPQAILAELAGLEAEIFQGLRDLVGMLKS